MQFLKHYQKISLNLAEVSRVFKMIGAGVVDQKKLLTETGFGDNKVRAMKEYLKDFGLLGEKGIITSLGSIILEKDSRFQEPFTRWILLYNWSKKENNPFLYFLINDSLGISKDQDMEERFTRWANRNDVKTEYDGGMVSQSINRTIAALTDTAGFQSLNLFINTNSKISRGQPYHVDALLIAYVLYHNRKKRSSIGFSELLEEWNNIALFFDLHNKLLEERIIELNNLGLTRLIQFADLHMIEYCFEENPELLITRYYDEN